jgi:hypothetical protein
LIYFIFRDDTYAVSSVFACWVIIGELAARVMILLEKGPSRHHISEDQQFQKNTQKLIFHQKMKVAKRRERGEQPGAHTTRWHGPGPGRATRGVATLAHFCHCPLANMVVPKNLRPGGSEIDSAASAGQKTPRERKLSGR